jgi:hypothetical protein
METKDAIELVQSINQIALDIKTAYGKRLADKKSTNPYIVAARAKMEVLNQIVELIKERSK